MQSNTAVKSHETANLSTMHSLRARDGNSAGGSCKKRMTPPRVTRATGFTLLELMIVAAIMVVVMAVVMRGIIEMQHRNAAESSKVDTVQQTRDFIDQMVRDIHDVGYPPPKVVKVAGGANCTADPDLSCNIIAFSPTQIIYEGDLDGSGTVYRIFMQLVTPPGSNSCPCILRRGALGKAAALAPGAQPTYFTEVNGVLNSGDGTGLATFPISLPAPGSYATYATADVFDAYFQDGTRFQDAGGAYSCDERVTPNSCSGIRSFQVNANVTSAFPDPKTNIYQVYAITSKARLNNM
jgi:prepilin-type N-terminal cleavage/methylation domain-containing protein